MKLAFTALFIALSVITMTSCDSAIKNQRLKRIDSLGTYLNHVNEVTSNVDSALIEKRINNLSSTGDWVLANITDTLDPKPGITFGDHLRCKKFYDKSRLRLMQVKTELKYSEKQLQKLRTDVENSFYSDEEFEGYFKTEAQAIEKLVNASDELAATYESVNAQYDYTKPKVDAIVDSIKAIIYSPEPI